MKKTLIITALAATSLLTSCNDWLDLLPNNEQVTENYWKSKEEVESVVASGYYYLRNAVPQMLAWGELRGGTLYNNSSTDNAGKIQVFDAHENNPLVSYGTLYNVINMANSVLRYVPIVEDNTYYDAQRNAHLCEAYFQRAYAYSLLVKNYKEVPLIVEAYVNDDAEFNLPKASESQIIAQIKADCLNALATGAAKANYENEWETKGRATKWALYALLADITLWNHEYDECITYCNQLIEAEGTFRPVFIKEMSKWFEMFNPGNSNESIFEINWNYQMEGKNNNFASRFAWGSPAVKADGAYNIAPAAVEKMRNEITEVMKLHPDLTVNDHCGRSLFGTWVPGNTADSPSKYATSMTYYVWKYRGQEMANIESERLDNGNDANFILYRMADIMLMKAEALVMKGKPSWSAAIALINAIRERAGLSAFIDLSQSTANDDIETLDENLLLTEVLEQREMEFVGEAKRWYDLLRIARYDKRFQEDFQPNETIETLGEVEKEHYLSAMGQDAFGYKQKVIDLICEYNTQMSDAQLKATLQNSWAWYLPLPVSDIDTNDQLKQNPYYATSK